MAKLERFTKRRLYIVCGSLLLMVSVLSSIGWFFFLGPYRRGHELHWIRENANQLIWDATQKHIGWIGWQHDDSLKVGMWGDEEWAAWIIERMEPGDDISSCSAGHKDSALYMMTNQNAGESADDWIAWWKDNNHKNQEQWIIDGFRRMGLELHNPLQKKDMADLLRIISRREEDIEVRLNAFRWLRYSGFSESSLLYEDIPPDNPNEVMNGIKIYFGWNVFWHKKSAPRMLTFHKESKAMEGALPGICSTKTRIGASTFITATFVLGIFFIHRARQREK